MKVFVYHAIMPNFGFPTKDRPDPIFPTDYTKVAEVTIPQRVVNSGPLMPRIADIAYKLTQNIDTSWELNQYVEKLVPGQQRSTSVGDVVEINGIAYKCEPTGWKSIVCQGCFNSPCACLPEHFPADPD